MAIIGAIAYGLNYAGRYTSAAGLVIDGNILPCAQWAIDGVGATFYYKGVFR